MKLTLAQTVSTLKQAGFSGPGLAIAVAVAYAESNGLDPLATNTVGNSAGTDRGLFQINSYYHNEVSDACAFDPLCNAKAAFQISKGGTDWSQWSTFKNGLYLKYLNLINGSGASVSDSQIHGTTTAPPLAGDPCDYPCTFRNPAACISLATCKISAGARVVAQNFILVSVAGVGIYLLFRQSINSSVKTGVKTAAKAAAL